MFGFSKQSRKIEGDIGYYGLEDWWLSAFDEDQREYIVTTFQPMGGRPRGLVEGHIDWSSGTAASLLSGLSSWFMAAKDRDIGRIILAKGLELSQSSEDPLDRHFILQGLIQMYYRDRDRPGFYEQAIAYCKEQINMQHAAAAKFKSEYPDQLLPAHVGYEQYAIILEKEKKYDEAIALSTEASDNGWAGDWDNRIERCKKRKAKAS